MDIEAIFADYDEDRLRSIMVGVKIDYDKVLDKETMKSAAVHCVLNGPVGVGKTTTFPEMGNVEIRLKDLYEGRLSNRMWREFCRTVAEHLVRRYPEVCTSSQQFKLYDAVWPLNEDNDD